MAEKYHPRTEGLTLAEQVKLITAVNKGVRARSMTKLVCTMGPSCWDLETLQKMARKNMPETRTACLWYKPTCNQTDVTPNYWLHETESWLVFPHELEGLTVEEIGQKWDPEIANIIKAPGGPFAQ